MADRERVVEIQKKAALLTWREHRKFSQANSWNTKIQILCKTKFLESPEIQVMNSEQIIHPTFEFGCFHL